MSECRDIKTKNQKLEQIINMNYLVTLGSEIYKILFFNNSNSCFSCHDSLVR